MMKLTTRDATVLSLFLIAVIGCVIIVVQSQLTPPVSRSVPARAAVTQRHDADAGSENRYDPPVDMAYDELLVVAKRNLFAPLVGVTPPAPPTKPELPPAPVSAPAKPTPKAPTIAITGIIRFGDEVTAMVENTDTGEVLNIAEGETAFGHTLRRVGLESAMFTRNDGEMVRLSLGENKGRESTTSGGSSEEKKPSSSSSSSSSSSTSSFRRPGGPFSFGGRTFTPEQIAEFRRRMEERRRRYGGGGYNRGGRRPYGRGR